MTRFACLRTIALTMVLVAVGLVSLAAAQGESDLTDHPWIGETAPEIDLPTVRGEQLKLSSLRGEYVVIHFGTSW